MDSTSLDKLVFWASLGTLGFFILIFSAYLLKIQFVLLGVVQELLTIPLMLGEWVLLVWAIRSFVRQKYEWRSYAFAASIFLLIAIAISWGGLFVKV